MQKECDLNLLATFIKFDLRSNACGKMGRVQQCSVITETATIHSGTLKTIRMITYFLRSTSWIDGAMQVEKRIEYHSPQ